MRGFLAWFWCGFGIPSVPLSRYTEDFGALLSGKLRLNSSPQFLHYVLLPPLPAYDPPDGQFAVERDSGSPLGPPNDPPVSPRRLSPLPQDLPIAAARLHLGGLVSDTPHPKSDLPCTSWGPGVSQTSFPPCCACWGASRSLPQTSHPPLCPLRGPGAPPELTTPPPKPDMTLWRGPGALPSLHPQFPPVLYGRRSFRGYP